MASVGLGSQWVKVFVFFHVCFVLSVWLGFYFYFCLPKYFVQNFRNTQQHGGGTNKQLRT